MQFTLHQPTFALLTFLLSTTTQAFEPVAPPPGGNSPPPRVTSPSRPKPAVDDDDWTNTPPPEAPSPFAPGAQTESSANRQLSSPFEAPEPAPPPATSPETLAGVDLTQVTARTMNQPTTNGPIRLRISRNTGMPVRYEVFSHGQRYRYELQPGSQQQFTEDRLWGIRFHRGDADIYVNYRLLEGEYEFDWTRQGWTLQQVTAGATLPPPPPRKTAASTPNPPDNNRGAPAPPTPLP